MKTKIIFGLAILLLLLTTACSKEKAGQADLALQSKGCENEGDCMKCVGDALHMGECNPEGKCEDYFEMEVCEHGCKDGECVWQ